MPGKKIFIFFLLFIFSIQVFLLLFFNRSYLLSNYDVSYWKERFEHSQWALPLSNRIIGDDGLFSYVGYRLAQGDDPSKINPETQPVGKYLIGFSIAVFKNPAYYSIILGFSTLLVYFLLVRKIFKNNLIAFIPTVILLLDPLFFTQLWKPWIDITQLFFLLCNILLLSFITLKNKHNYFLPLVCGLTLGLFVQTKLPVLLPVILVLEFLFFFKNNLKKEFVLYILGLLIGILVPYIQYFLLGNSLIDFIKLQKYIVNFYQSSLLVTHFGAIWQSLLLGDFPNISGGGYTKIVEWWILWPVAFIVSLFCIFMLFVKKNKDLLTQGIALFMLSELIIFAVIPSYPRYLLIIIPFIYLLAIYFIEHYLNFKYKNFIYILVLLISLLNSFLFLLPKPDPLLANFYHNFSNQYFQDIYQENILKSSSSIKREEFKILALNVMNDSTVKKIEIKEKEKNIPLFSSKGIVKIEVTYKTQDLGSFSQEKNIELVKENSLWKIKWDWDILLNEFKPEYVVSTSVVNGKRGSIIDKTGKIYAKDDLSYLISVNPEQINTKKEQEMLKAISILVGIIPVRLQNTYLENILPKSYVPLATLFKEITKEEKTSLLSFPGVKITPYYSRLYYYPELDSQNIENTFYKECCTRIYSSFNYHGIKGVEKSSDNILSGQSGGKIMILDNNGKIIKTIFDKEFKNGQDVILSL